MQRRFDMRARITTSAVYWPGHYHMTAMTSMHWTCSDLYTHVGPPLRVVNVNLLLQAKRYSLSVIIIILGPLEEENQIIMGILGHQKHDRSP